MELWIRSQDRTRLGKIELIEYQEDDYGFYLFGWKDKFEGTRLATYKTKERALQILDEIQNILQPRVIVHQPNIDYDDMIHSLTEDICLRTTQKVDMELKQAGQVVYQMPKE